MEPSGELTTHLTTGAMIVYILEWLKRSRWFPWISDHQKTLQRVLSAGAAVVVAVGINWNYDPAMEGGTLVIHGLNAQTVLAAVYEFLKQFMAQQVIYDTIVPKVEARKVVVDVQAGLKGTGDGTKV